MRINEIKEKALKLRELESKVEEYERIIDIYQKLRKLCGKKDYFIALEATSVLYGGDRDIDLLNGLFWDGKEKNKFNRACLDALIKTSKKLLVDAKKEKAEYMAMVERKNDKRRSIKEYRKKPR